MNVKAIKKIFENILLHPSDKDENSDFLVESLSRSTPESKLTHVSNSYSDIADEHILQNALTGIGTINAEILEVSLDSRIIKDAILSRVFKINICKKFGIRPEYVNVVIRPISKAQLQTGDPVGHVNLVNNDKYGTLGGFLLPKGDKRKYRFFSNNHVLADTNKAKAGDEIYLYGAKKDLIGVLENFHFISQENENHLDLAVSLVEDKHAVPYGKFPGIRQAMLGERVTKIGATTGNTRGKIVSVDWTEKIDYGLFNAIFVDQIKIKSTVQGKNFSLGGDSGSLVFSSEDGKFVGLHFAGNGNYSFSNPAILIADQFKNWGY